MFAMSTNKTHRTRNAIEVVIWKFKKKTAPECDKTKSLGHLSRESQSGLLRHDEQLTLAWERGNSLVGSSKKHNCLDQTKMCLAYPEVELGAHENHIYTVSKLNRSIVFFTKPPDRAPVIQSLSRQTLARCATSSTAN